MTAINVQCLGASTVALLLERASPEIELKTSLAVRHYGQLLLTKVRSKASGRPGPNVITGDYRRSWSMRMGHAAGLTTAWVGTNAPQGRRLEYGFHGQDALGRHYDQPPYPHAEPALNEISPDFQKAVYDILEELL